MQCAWSWVAQYPHRQVHALSLTAASFPGRSGLAVIEVLVQPLSPQNHSLVQRNQHHSVRRPQPLTLLWCRHHANFTSSRLAAIFATMARAAGPGA
jgi:hypothetical protein